MMLSSLATSSITREEEREKNPREKEAALFSSHFSDHYLSCCSNQTWFSCFAYACICVCVRTRACVRICLVCFLLLFFIVVFLCHRFFSLSFACSLVHIDRVTFITYLWMMKGKGGKTWLRHTNSKKRISISTIRKNNNNEIDYGAVQAVFSFLCVCVFVFDKNWRWRRRIARRHPYTQHMHA